MNTQSHPLTRREAQLNTHKGGVVAAAPAAARAAPTAPTSIPEPAFVPENDYPYFGPEPGVPPGK